ncbi:MAG TPA: carboxypeptidase-like regulatory domain-containing protein [Pyrinomonadaceae bacterium]|nr:carboxypeptidase-like regulatory domain-containing protein [Pyrinomonadaceae bacterium]
MKERLFNLAAAFVLLVLTCATATAQQPTATPETSPEVTSGAISGSIVNERGEPMPGASVFLRAMGSINSGRTAAADAEGRFRLTGLEAGLYQITGYSPAYVFQLQDADTPQSYYRVGDSVRVEMIKGGVITGTVVNATGEPIVGIRVRAIRVRDPKGQVARTPQFNNAERSTDDRGMYRIYGLAPGTYVVSAGGAGNQSYQLTPYETDVPLYAPSSSRDTATEFTVRSGEETTADIRYRSEMGHTVSGSVKVAATNGAAVTLTPVEGSGFMPAGNTMQAPGGRGFEMSGIGDGEYYVVAMELPVNQMNVTTMPDIPMSEPKRITVKGADVSGIELITRPSSSLGGRVALEPSKAPECQGKRKPLFAETLIDLVRHEKDADAQPIFMRMMASAMSPDPKGAFVFRNLTPGRYRLDTSFHARFWYLQSISIGAPSSTPTAAKTATPKIDPAASWTIVKPGEKIADVTITLAEGAASIRGKVPVAEGAAIASGAIYLVPAETDKAADVLRYFITNVSSDGTFTLNSLPPGRYWSLLQNPVQTELATLIKLRSPESAEARTKLRRSAESQKSEVELKPCQTLTDYQLSFK